MAAFGSVRICADEVRPDEGDVAGPDSAFNVQFRAEFAGQELAAASRDAGPAKCIKGIDQVHGHWMIEVQNLAGTVTAQRGMKKQFKPRR